LNVEVYADKAELAEAAGEGFVGAASRAIEERGRFAVALAGGSTPKALYGLLADRYRDAIDWSRVHAFFGDERPVPPDHEDSNYRMAKETLLDRVQIGSVHRMRGELAPAEAARLYEEELRGFFDLAPGEAPRFDLILLGMGEDGHTLSLFPRTPALEVRDRLAVENPVEKLGQTRITLTLPVVDAARAATFLVSGSGKAEAVRAVLSADADPRDYPARLARLENGNLTFMLDREAADLLG
jgi:6-phosphogluconolactonase